MSEKQRQNASKQSMYDDLAFSPAIIFLGCMGVSNDHPVMGGFLIILGIFWLGVRLYDLTHQDEVFGKDE